MSTSRASELRARAVAEYPELTIDQQAELVAFVQVHLRVVPLELEITKQQIADA